VYPQSYHAFVAVGLGVVLLREGTLLLVSVADQLMMKPASKKRSLSHRLEFKDFLAQYLLCISVPRMGLSISPTWGPRESIEFFNDFNGNSKLWMVLGVQKDQSSWWLRNSCLYPSWDACGFHLVGNGLETPRKHVASLVFFSTSLTTVFTKVPKACGGQHGSQQM